MIDFYDLNERTAVLVKKGWTFSIFRLEKQLTVAAEAVTQQFREQTTVAHHFSQLHTSLDIITHLVVILVNKSIIHILVDSFSWMDIVFQFLNIYFLNFTFCSMQKITHFLLKLMLYHRNNKPNMMLQKRFFSLKKLLLQTWKCYSAELSPVWVVKTTL